jgi:ubiquinone/menaquinone biosynthesis C-methylase UbiE
MTDLAERRKAEFPQYERPAYFGIMRKWRRVLFKEWLVTLNLEGETHYIDVGCGLAESLEIANGLGFKARGCDVVQSACNRSDVDLIPGAHDLGIYKDNQFHVLTCNDVLEHVLEEDVPAALREMGRVTSRAILLGISSKPGKYHCTIKSDQWWMEQIGDNIGISNRIYADRIPPIKQPYLFVEVTL